MGRIIGRLIATVLFGWLFNACLNLAGRCLRWLEVDSGIAEWPWRWILTRLALLAGILVLIVAGLLLIVRLVTGGSG